MVGRNDAMFLISLSPMTGAWWGGRKRTCYTHATSTADSPGPDCRGCASGVQRVRKGRADGGKEPTDTDGEREC